MAEKENALEKNLNNEAPVTTTFHHEAPIAPEITSKFQKWWTEEEERAIKRKFDVRVVLVLSLLYLWSLLDRGNIGNAKTAGMEQSLRISDSQYQLLLTIFYIFYIVFQCGVMGYQIFPARIWIFLCVTVWGIAGICQAATKTWGGMVACRAFLAASEACFGTGIALYMSFFYPKNELGLRFGIFISAGAISSAIAGAIAYGLVHTSTSVAPWRLLFLIEGVPTLLMVPFLYFVLPNNIQTASFLTEREKQIAEARLFRPPPAPIPEGETLSIRYRIKEQMSWRNTASAFKDPLSYIFASLFFIINVAYSSVPVYLPTLISEMGYGSIRAQALSAPPYVAAFLLAIFCCWFSDRIGMRGPLGIFLLAMGGTGFVMLATLQNTHARYAAVWLVVNGLFPFIPVLYMWLMNNQSGQSKKGVGLVIFGTIGQCGPILGTRLFPNNQKPYYVKGTAVSGGLLLLGVVIASATSVYLYSVNRKRDRVQGDMTRLERPTTTTTTTTTTSSGTPEEARSQFEIEERKVDVLIRGEKSPYFRYTI